MAVIATVPAEHAAPIVTEGAPLDLDSSHRELAQLIRASQRSACRGDSIEVRATADQLVARIVHHLETERGSLEHVAADRRASLADSQRTLLERVVAYAARPTVDGGANLLALLVRHADAERAALTTVPPAPPRKRPRYEFATDWAIAVPGPALVGEGS